MIRETVNALLACLVTLALCAVAYPAAVYGLGHTLFPVQARGSLIERDGKVVGSELIAQPFSSDKYFAPRPSAAGANGYAADAASGSNLGTTNPALRDRIALDAARKVASKTGDADLKAGLERLDALQGDLKARREIREPSQAHTDAIARQEAEVATLNASILDRSAEVGIAPEALVPVDLVTASGAGLDPHISPDAARYQAARVASARGLTADRVEALIEAHTDRSGEFIGAPPRVNVLLLNLALDREKSATGSGPAGPASAAIKIEASPASVAIPAAPVHEVPSANANECSSSPAMETVSTRPDTPQARADAAPGSALIEEVGELRARVDRLAEGVRVASDSHRRIDQIDERVSGLDRDMEVLRTGLKEARDDEHTGQTEEKLRAIAVEVEAFKNSTRRAETAWGDANGAIPVEGLDQAMRLFQGKRYAEAAEAFREVARSRPDDARAWYHAALARGFTTSQWRGEVVALVNKGVELEIAPSPSPEIIDKSFSDLTKDSGRDWLSYYRKLAIKK